MKYLHLLSSCALALSFVPSPASADEPSLVHWAEARVETGIVKPLAERERARSRFSRSRPPPRERRIRILETSLRRDKQGRDFVAFAVDERFVDWRDDDIVGCVYRASGSLFIKRGDAYFPAARLLGKNVAAVAGVCQASSG